MRVSVQGLWHLGCVTAACVAEHFPTSAYDPDPQRVAELTKGKAPIFEPELSEQIQRGLTVQKLRFSQDLVESIQDADVVWVTYDTPVDDRDVADTEYVAREVTRLFPHLRDGTVVLVSSQVPVGFTARIEQAFRSSYPRVDVGFACSPENLRLGRAMEAFRHPGRVVLGIRRTADRSTLSRLFAPFCEQLEWMSAESAEMTKHALNSFLATSVAFANEIASLCEKVGADAKEVERGLKSDVRVGSRAYLGPGGPFAGGTLGRDVGLLVQLGDSRKLSIPLIRGVRQSNDEHKSWLRHKVTELLGGLAGRTMAVLGLTYKPETDTLRRSEAIEFCRWASQGGATIQAYDPVVKHLPAGLAEIIQLRPSVAEALQRADAMIVATEWKQFREIAVADILGQMRTPIVIDGSRFLGSCLASDRRIRYAAVGLQARGE